MSHTVCEKCNGWIFPNQKGCVKCAYNEKHKVKPHDCKKDGHVNKQGLITMFVCMYCDYHGELAPELQPSEAELAVSMGVSPYSSYEDDNY